jgi:hypothetical protein
MAATQHLSLPPRQDLQTGGQILVPIHYRISGEDASLAVSGLGGVVLYDPSQLEFLGY